MSKKIYIATRKSPLALWQAQTTQKLLLNLNIQSELSTIVTTGDKLQHTQLSSVTLDNNPQLQMHATKIPHHLSTGKGLFIKEIQEALLSGQAQIAVHSMKDLPVEQTPGLVIGALLPRATPNDVLVLSPQIIVEIAQSRSQLSKEVANRNVDMNSISFENLKSLLLRSSSFLQKPIGTTSSRRQLLMRNLFSPKLNLQILRGNVDSRLKKVNNNEFSAILLAQAGLERLNLFDTKTMFTLPTDLFIPATAQGVVAIECREDNHDLIEILKKINCSQTCLQAGIERMVLYFLGGDCNSSIGVHYSSQQIYIIYHKENIEKEFKIEVTLEELKEIENLINGNYSSFFANALKSSLANKIKNELLAKFNETSSI